MMKLGRKKTTNNQDWIDAYENIENIVSKEEYFKKEEELIQAVKNTVRSKKVAYAWSGGKDSLVLSVICEKAGIFSCVLGVCGLEYPAYFKWARENRPAQCEIVNTGLDMEWLVNNPGMLFPRSSEVSAKWYRLVHQRAQCEFYRKNRLDMLVLGRRKADGNYCGQNGIYKNAGGLLHYNPLFELSHEMVLAGIKYNNLLMPPIYQWHDGYVQGTHPWPARFVVEEQQGWKEIWEIDKQIVKNASQYLQGAEKFLNQGVKDAV